VDLVDVDTPGNGPSSLAGGLTMSTKAKPRTGSALDLAGGEDEKISNIVEEVDRFFKNVHADIEDWKFSMEEYGDGTRIFVRFQVHINKAGTPPAVAGPAALNPKPVESEAPAVSPVLPAERAQAAVRKAAADVREMEGVGAATRADLDLASFVEVWRSKRESGKGGEYHKPGAPYMDSDSESNVGKDLRGLSPSDTAGEHADEKPRTTGGRS
jgi:hypothetical protein